MKSPTRKSAWELNDRVAQQEIASASLCLDRTLFGDNHLSRSPFVFVHVDAIDQEAFVNLIVRNNVSLVMDLRYKPVFQEPEFDHRFVIEYLSRRNTLYIDFIYDAISEENFTLRFSNAFKELSVSNFWSVFLFDDQTVETHLLSEFRREFRKVWERFTEVHPETAFGRSVWASLPT